VNERLTAEKFGDIIDEMLQQSHVQMLIDMPEGTIEPTIKDTLGLGGTVQFYILLNALKPVFKDICDNILDPNKTEDFVDGGLKLVKADLMEVVGQCEEGAPDENL
jgi:hypothetical protein